MVKEYYIRKLNDANFMQYKSLWFLCQEWILEDNDRIKDISSEPIYCSKKDVIILESRVVVQVIEWNCMGFRWFLYVKISSVSCKIGYGNEEKKGVRENSEFWFE